MHNVNVEAVEQTAAKAKRDPGVVVQSLAFDGDWQTRPGAAQFRADLEAIRQIADDHCPGAWCLRNPLELHTHLSTAEETA
jgi:hypothetical protein